MMKFCPNCNDFKKVKVRYTLPSKEGILRENYCLDCKVVFQTIEEEMAKSDFLRMKREAKNVQ